MIYLIFFHCYHPPTKLQKVDVFNRVCLSFCPQWSLRRPQPIHICKGAWSQPPLYRTLTKHHPHHPSQSSSQPPVQGHDPAPSWTCSKLIKFGITVRDPPPPAQSTSCSVIFTFPMFVQRKSVIHPISRFILRTYFVHLRTRLWDCVSQRLFLVQAKAMMPLRCMVLQPGHYGSYLVLNLLNILTL